VDEKRAHSGVLVTTALVSAETKAFAVRNNRLRIIEGGELKHLLAEYLDLDVRIDRYYPDLKTEPPGDLEPSRDGVASATSNKVCLRYRRMRTDPACGALESRQVAIPLNQHRMRRENEIRDQLGVVPEVFINLGPLYWLYSSRYVYRSLEGFEQPDPFQISVRPRID
jgi:hypothetical protein